MCTRTSYIIQTGTNEHIEQDSLATGQLATPLFLRHGLWLDFKTSKLAKLDQGRVVGYTALALCGRDYGMVRVPGVPLTIIISTLGLSLELHIGGKNSYFGRTADRQRVSRVGTEMSIEMSGWLNDNFIVFWPTFLLFWSPIWPSDRGRNQRLRKV